MMIDRTRVAEIIDDADPDHGATVLTDLEAAGYRVVRAGWVADINSLATVEQRLQTLGQITNTVSTLDVRSTAANLATLRRAAIAVLGIDPDDVDEVAG